MNEAFTPTEPVAPVAPWLGGKRFLAPRIIARLRSMPHEIYAEPFVGMGGIFLRRPWRTRSEVINDASREVTNLFRQLQRHHQALFDMLRWQLGSRAEFARLLRTDPTTLTELERAARFLYLQRLAFGRKAAGQSFGTSPSNPSRFDTEKLAPMLADVHERLSGVVIECLPYAEMMRRYDRAQTLFYLDPPYLGCERDYGDGMFERADFERLAELLRGLAGQFLLSINDTPEIRRVFAGFTAAEVGTTYVIGAKLSKGKRVGELLISR